MNKNVSFFKKHKNIIIAVVLIVVALSAAWFYGGNYAGRTDKQSPEQTTGSAMSNSTQEPSISQNDPSTDPTTDNTTGGTDASPSETPDTTSNTTIPPSETPGDNTAPSSTEPPTNSPDPTGTTATNPPETTVPPTAPPTTTTPEPTQDKYKTDPIPDGQPQPVEPQDVTVGDGSFTVTLTVRCDTILDNMDRLNKEKHELVPEDGVIFTTTKVTAYEGESVFNVLQRTMKQNRIHMAFRNTPIYNSAYIESINNLYEFDAGDLSGWMYSVNGWYPNYGCSRYQLKPGDVIEWNYTCDLGRDLGQEIGGDQIDE